MTAKEKIKIIEDYIEMIRYEDVINKSCGAGVVDSFDYAYSLLGKLEGEGE